MGSMMLTALDANTGRILNLVELDQRTRDGVHGIRVAKSNGYDIVCRQCEHGVHLKINHLRRAYWQHNPGNATRCILDSIKTGESQFHIAAKYTIAKSLGRLSGWTATPEQRFELDGEFVITDVYAQHAAPAGHQAPTAWEVQLSKQTSGDFIHRSEQRLRIAGCRTAWITPHADALGKALGVVSDPTGERVVARLFTNPYDDVPLPPMPLEQFVNKVARSRGHFLWTDTGEGRTWIAYPGDSTDANRSKRGNESSPGLTQDDEDRLCQRPTAASTMPPVDDRVQRAAAAAELARRRSLYEAVTSLPLSAPLQANPVTIPVAWPTSECPRCHKGTIAEFHGHCAACLVDLRARKGTT